MRQKRPFLKYVNSLGSYGQVDLQIPLVRG